ncbi:hypothetical protein [Pontibacter sp. G13]|uniref:hypothetical protein n=1 Tax=Pontibacter sp. G13 TaxID=3074898 RepID=UPI00288A54A9|nr:hypothetical protein [Pontibacter sp. G13]WNJ20728.1 hypothetical protein RJD25_09620 [Pontibacter sp. G13]
MSGYNVTSSLLDLVPGYGVSSSSFGRTKLRHRFLVSEHDLCAKGCWVTLGIFAFALWPGGWLRQLFWGWAALASPNFLIRFGLWLRQLFWGLAWFGFAKIVESFFSLASPTLFGLGCFGFANSFGGWLGLASPKL